MPAREPTKRNPRHLLGGSFPHISEELQTRRRAVKRQRRVHGRGYMADVMLLSTVNDSNLSGPRILRGCSNFAGFFSPQPVHRVGPHAALEPHSSDVLSPRWDC